MGLGTKGRGLSVGFGMKGRGILIFLFFFHNNDFYLISNFHKYKDKYALHREDVLQSTTIF